ncbi:MAG TPA: VOC family protein [Chloroflexota bacterium]
MAEASKSGAVCWVDHCVVPVTDLERWLDFYARVLGAEQRPFGEGDGAPAANLERPMRNGEFGPGAPRGRKVAFTWVGPCHVGGSVASEMRPSKGLGVGAPRYSYFIRPKEIEDHLRRLDEQNVAHLDPLRTDEEGEEGTAIRFEDPDGNQLEFWAPVAMPDGAMDDESSAKVGRIAAATFESRDLTRTLDFFNEFCHLEPALDTARDKMVFPLAAGGRLVFKHVDDLGDRTLGHTPYRALHTALVVRDEQFLPLMRNMWEKLPEWDFDPESTVVPRETLESLPARTCIHGAPIGPEWKATVGRGDSFCDWDTNGFHFMGATEVDGSMAHPKGVSERAYMEAEKALS